MRVYETGSEVALPHNGGYFGRMLQLNRLQLGYLMGDVDPKGQATRSMTEEIFDQVKDELPGFKGGFGLGFPYHSTDQSGKVVGNPEFKSYSDNFAQIVSHEMAQSALWPCVDCQSTVGFHPKNCGDCSLTGLKPLTVMKTMPDLDTFAIFEDVGEKSRNEIWQLAQERGFAQSDFDTASSLDKIATVMQNITNNQHNHQTYLPLDLHIIAKNDYLVACKQIGLGETDVRPSIWSMYGDWKENKKIDFWFDFVFGMSPFESSMDPEVLSATQHARHGLANHYSSDEVIDIVKRKSKRAVVLLKYPPTNRILINKIDSWRSK